MKMKNKNLIIVLVIVLNVIAIYMVGNTVLKGDSEYENYIKAGKENQDKELYSKAYKQYEAALELEDTIDVRKKLVEIYLCGLENKEFNDYDMPGELIWDMVEAFRDEKEGYEYAVEYFWEEENYVDCCAVILQARSFKIKSEKINEIENKIQYEYSQSGGAYADILPQIDGVYAVSMGEKYGFLNQNAGTVIGSEFDYVSAYCEGLALVKKDGYTMLIDATGERQAYLPDSVVSSSGVGNGLLSCLEEDVYKYYDQEGEYRFGKYEFAGKFVKGVAAVKEGKKWYVIGTNGKKVTDTAYEDIILNEHKECAVNGVIWAKKDGKYKMYDVEMKQIGDLTCDNARVFATDEYTAFEKSGKWGFVDSQGEVQIEPAFEEAKAFSNGFAAVKKGEFWSLINGQGKEVITGNFQDIDYMNSNRICFVKTEEYWGYISLYYRN